MSDDALQEQTVPVPVSRSPQGPQNAPGCPQGHAEPSVRPGSQPASPTAPAAFLSVKQVAGRLAVSSDTVTAWIRSRQLRATLISKSPRSRKLRFRIAEADLATFVAGRTFGAAPARPARRRRPEYDRIV